jgi:ABC-2 type transport system permease protein
MRTLFWHAVRRLQWQVVGWGGTFFFIGIMVCSTYAMVQQQAEQVQQLLRSLPPQFAMFLGDTSQITNPHGYLALRLHSFIPAIMGFFAVLAGSGMLAIDEEKGFLDLLLSYPVVRMRLFVARTVALLVAIVGVCVLGWAGLVVGIPGSGMALNATEALPPFVSLVGVMACLAALSVLASNVLPSRHAAAAFAGFVLVMGFVLTAFSRLDSRFEPWARVLPFYHFNAKAKGEGVDPADAMGLWVASIMMFSAAAWRFQVRDIRLSGEGVGLGRIHLPRRRTA